MGIWAQREITVAWNDVPILGESRTENRVLVRIAISPEAPEEAHIETCAIEIRGAPDAATQTVVPDAFVRAVEVQSRPVQVDPDGRFSGGRLVEIDGARLDRPSEDALPTTADDPRVTDPDADGHPGLTVRITGLVDGEVYVVQRRITTLTGTQEGDRLHGRIEWAAEQNILGADNPALTHPIPSRPDPDPALDVFDAQRVSKDRDCAWIRAHAEALFGD